jgi:murein DD-endopeptidase MepM/ murein hydrolase activator NlpD
MVMKNNFIKFIYFVPDDENPKYVRFRLFNFVLAIGLLFFVSAFLTGAVSKVLISFIQKDRIAFLQSENEQLERLLGEFSDKTEKLESRLASIKQREDIFRAMANIDTIDQDTWEIGVGGSKNNTDGLNPGVTSERVEAAYTQLEQMERQVNFILASQMQIEKKLVADQNIRLHTPSVSPLTTGAITSLFGKRVDPFVQQIKHHNGIDIVTEHGTPVLSPSAGRVAFIRNTYKRNEALGKVIVIDHGYGIRTRYGHLHKIYVKAGQKVKRFDKIGVVGNTGRSTGTHLHYEVIVNGKFRNPQEYILN